MLSWFGVDYSRWARHISNPLRALAKHNYVSIILRMSQRRDLANALRYMGEYMEDEQAQKTFLSIRKMIVKHARSIDANAWGCADVVDALAELANRNRRLASRMRESNWANRINSPVFDSFEEIPSQDWVKEPPHRVLYRRLEELISIIGPSPAAAPAAPAATP